VSKNGDGASNDDPSGNGSVPRLTVGQKVLAALPNLQRQPAAPTRPSPSTRPVSARPGRSPESASDNGTDDDLSPDEVLPATATPQGKLRDAFLKPSGPRPARGAPSGMSKEELDHVIKRIDDRERLLAFSSAGLGVVVGVILTIAAVHYYGPVHAKDHESTGFILFEGAARLVLAAVVVLAAWKRRRSFVAFALLFLGTSLGFPFALPFWALGVWMIFRVLKWQRELAAMTGTTARTRPAPAAKGRDAAEARRKARNDRMAQRTAGGRRKKKEPEPTGPPPNKRYTPPKPPRPRPGTS
jgi:hypothetical protein